MPTFNDGFSAEDIEFAARVVAGTYDPETGRHPESIFHAINATAVRTVVELVIVDPVKHGVLLTRRDEDDPYYAGAWHLPGVIGVQPDIGNGDTSAADNAALRAKAELGGTMISALVPLSPKWLAQDPRISRRGGEAAVFYGAYLLDKEPEVGAVFRTDELPDPIHEHHPEIIQAGPSAVQLAHADLQHSLITGPIL